MKNYLNSTKAPVITIVKNVNENMDNKNNAPVITFYDWLQKKYGCFDGKRHASPATPQGFADYARYTVEVLEDYIGEPRYNLLSEWHEWLFPFYKDEKVMECFVQLWHEYRQEVPVK